MLERGLKAMSAFYASLTVTCVLIYKDIIIPDDAEAMQGISPATPAATWCIECRASLSTAEQAWGNQMCDTCWDAGKAVGRAGGRVHSMPQYNATPYDGDGGRGWCIYEQGVCMTAAAHLHAAASSVGEGGLQSPLPMRFQRAQASRAKIIDISGGISQPREVTQSPEEVLKEATRMIAIAKFTGRADAKLVPHLLAVFEWDMRTAIARATTDYAASGQTVDGAVRKRATSIKTIKQRTTASPGETPSSALMEVHDNL